MLDQSQQLLLNEQNKNQLLLETKTEPASWEQEKESLKNSLDTFQNLANEANQRASANYAYAKDMERWLWIAMGFAGIFLVLLIILGVIHFL